MFLLSMFIFNHFSSETALYPFQCIICCYLMYLPIARQFGPDVQFSLEYIPLPAISHHTKLKYLIPWALLKQMHFILQFLPFDSPLFLGKSFSNKLTCSLLMNYVFLNFSFYVTNLVECISPFACTINVDQKRESQERNEALQVNNEDLYFLMKLPKS